MDKFHEVTIQLEQALHGITYENLDISDEVKEQVETRIFLVSFFWVITEDLRIVVLFLYFFIFPNNLLMVHYIPVIDLKSLFRRSKEKHIIPS